jgi:MFS family permease
MILMKTEKETVDSKKDKLFARNLTAAASGEIFWGIGLPVVVESTFLQVFLRNLGASSLVVGLVPTFFFIGVSLFGLLSGYLTGHLKNKKKVILLTHGLGALPIPLFGVILYITGSSGITLALFLCMYGLFSLGVGLILPIWQNYIVMLFSERRVFSAMAGVMLAQSAAKLTSSFVILKVVQRYSLEPRASAVIFIGVGVTFFIGTLLYLLSRQVVTDEEQESRQANFFRHLSLLRKRVFANRQFLLYLASDIETFAVIGIISFYANYAVEHKGIPAAYAAGLFVLFIYTGHISVHLLLGWLNLLKLKNKFFLAKTTALLGVSLLLLGSHLAVFLLVSYLLGVSRGIRYLGFPPAVKRLSGMEDATLYFSIAPILVLPFSAGLPVLNGIFLDHFASLEGASYKIVFAAMGIIVLATVFFLRKVDFRGNATAYRSASSISPKE